jgi:4-hydroxy-4-methyl-2-oxoglutarate aldolase
MTTIQAAGDDVARLRRLDVCAVSDALDSFGLPGVVDAVVPVTGATRIGGRVIPVLLGSPRGGGSGRHLCTAAVMAGGEDDVIVVAHQGRFDSAGWGGNLSRAAKQRRVAGTIVDGAVRDVDESRDVGYAVFASSVTPRTARGRTEEHSWGEPVRFGGVDVATGDLVIADGSGVAFVRSADAERVLAKAEEIAEKEATMAAAIDRGEPVDAVMGQKYETMIAGTGDE